MAHAPDLFIDVPLNARTQDLYIVRTAIREALRGQLSRFSGTFLDVGCGVMPYRRMIT
jgi:hypothetical protein